MKISAQIIFAIFLLTSFKTDNTIVVDKEEGQKAFLLLQDIRSNPNKYYQELGFNENEHVSAITLNWNDTLAKVAEAKAYDLANRDYFAHVDPDGYGINYFMNKAGYTLNPNWLIENSDNYFESISAGNESGEDAIRILVTDKGTPGLGHRVALLGLDDWNAKATDIGIGFVRSDSGSRYKTYTCVIVARHDW